MAKRRLNTSKQSVLPWYLHDYPRHSAILDAKGHVVFGSLICQSSPQSRANHRYIADKLGLSNVGEFRGTEYEQ